MCQGSEAPGAERTVLQLFRRPYLSEEAAATLARKANAKPAINGEAASLASRRKPPSF